MTPLRNATEVPPPTVAPDVTGGALSTATFLDDLDKMRTPSVLFSNEVPLGPASGGRTIDPETLALGDLVLLTRAPGDLPLVLRDEAAPLLSQVAFHVGHQRLVIDTDAGLREEPLSAALAKSTRAVALRHPGMNTDRAGKLITYLADPPQPVRNAGQFARLGQLRLGILPKHCASQSANLQEKCRQFVGRIDLGTAGNNATYVGRGLLAAWAKTELNLSQEPIDWSAFGAALLPLTHNATLRYIGHLVGPKKIES